jgi:hypothetical protein
MEEVARMRVKQSSRSLRGDMYLTQQSARTRRTVYADEPTDGNPSARRQAMVIIHFSFTYCGTEMTP